MRLSEILSVLDVISVENFIDHEITGIAYDSRTLLPGNVFFCIKGLVTDGHYYASEAVEKGAAAIFTERLLDDELKEDIPVVNVPDTRYAMALCSAHFYGYPSKKLTLIGVTGTNGKTTTTYLVENCMRFGGRKTGLIGTVEYRIGDRVEPVTRTTPESVDLQKMLKDMVDEKVECVAMEVSSHGLELRRVLGCEFNGVVFTNLTTDHLDFHLSIEDYFAAKRRLFVEEHYGTGRIAFINTDDPFGKRIFKEIKLEKLSYGVESPADYRASGVEIDSSGNRFFIKHKGERYEARSLLKGGFNVYNCLAAFCVCHRFGLDVDVILRGIETYQGVPGRFENIECGQEFAVIVDYAHTPDGLKNVLEAARQVTEKRVICVFGCGGDRDKSKRPIMGEVCARLSDICVITSDNPRSEDPMDIIEMILEGIKGKCPEENYVVEPDRRKAIFLAVKKAEPGDLVLIAGKGHERGQIFSDRVVPFDDREVAREAIREVLGGKS